MKHRIRLTESDLHRIIKQSVKKVLKEAVEPGSVIHGTMRREDTIPAMMSVLFKEDPQKARYIWQENPELLQALCDQRCGERNDWWDSEDAQYVAEMLFDEMDKYSPEGHHFGTHPGDGSDIGYWPNEE